MRTRLKPDRRLSEAIFIAGILIVMARGFERGGIAYGEEGSPSSTPMRIAKVTEPAAAPEFIGAETCLNCHANREAFKDNIHAKAWPMVKGIPFEKSCETCHGPGSLHAQAAGDKTNPGYATIRNPKKLSAVELNKTCLQCHQDNRRLHWIGSRHESRDVSCVSCHSVHSAKSSKRLLVMASAAETCFQCHKDKKTQMQRSAHMPVREGEMSCTDCHNPHGSATPRMIKANSANDLCLSCHTEKRGPFLWDHPPVRENCLNCHNPHGSHQDKLLVAKRPLLCQRCHNATRHPSVIYDQTAIDQQNNRVFNKSCLNCHASIHGSNHPSGKFFLR